MPAKKPRALNKRHSTKKEKEARESSESALIPKVALSKEPPIALNGHAHATLMWNRLIDLYYQTDGTIVTAFDESLLEKYCLADEELNELAELREETLNLWRKHVAILEEMDVDPANLKAYFGALSQANALNQRYQSMDARMDGKRKYLHTLSQSLYLTPRSRAGVAPTEKEPEPPKSEMDKLLG